MTRPASVPAGFTPTHRHLGLATLVAAGLIAFGLLLSRTGHPVWWVWAAMPASALAVAIGLWLDETISSRELQQRLAGEREQWQRHETDLLEQRAQEVARQRLAGQGGRTGFREAAMRSAQVAIWQAWLQRGEMRQEGVHIGSREFSAETRQWKLRQWLRNLHPEDRQRVTLVSEDFFKGRIPTLQIDLRVNDERDGWRWVQLRGDVFERDASGRPDRICGVLMDVHHHKLTQIARNQMHGLLEVGPVVVFRLRMDAGLEVQYVSGNAARLWKREATSWKGHGLPLSEWLHPDDGPAFEKTIWNAYGLGQDGCSGQVRIRMGDGSTPWQNIRMRFEHEGGQATARGYVVDIDDRKTLESLTTERNQTMASVVMQLHRAQADNAALQECSDRLNSANDLIEATRIIQHVASLLFPGWSGALQVSEEAGTLVRATAWGTPPEQEHAFALHDCWALRRGKPHVYLSGDRHIRCRHVQEPRGVLHPYLCMPMVAHGETVGSLHLFADAACSDQDVADTEAQATRFSETVKLALSNLKLRSRLEEQATRDPLTGLYNRRLLDERLPIELRRSQRDGQPLTLAMLDIDHFKSINDNHGHDIGDAVLRSIGAFLAENTRAYDLTCRMGGEELVLLMPGCQTADAMAKMEAIRSGIAGLEVRHQGRLLPSVTVSIGMARSADDGVEGLLRRADAALYQAKREGRDRVVMNHGARELTA